MDEFQFEIIKAHINSLTNINELKKQQQLYYLTHADKLYNAFLPEEDKVTETEIAYYDELYKLATKRLQWLTKSLPKSPFAANTKPPNRR